MTQNAWLRWPSREALSRAGVSGARHALAWDHPARSPGHAPVGDLHRQQTALLGRRRGGFRGRPGRCGDRAWAFFRTTLRHRLLPSVTLLVALLGSAPAGNATDLRVPAMVLWCGCAVSAMERLPLAVAVPAAGVGLGA